MLSALDRFSKICFAAIARFIERKEVLMVIFQDMFYGAIRIARDPFGGGYVNHPWCELRVDTGRCNLPNQRFCTQACMGGYGVSGQCPPGFRPSHVWGYRITGCWCDTFQGRNIVCCDCTPADNSPYVRTAADCGCMHFIS